MFFGDDHLLITEKLGSSEDYIRVAFKDIRYVVYRRSEPKIATLILGILFLVLLRSGLGILILVRYFRRRGACVCYLVTDVDVIPIPLPVSYKKVPLFIEFLRSQGAQIASPTSSYAS